MLCLLFISGGYTFNMRKIIALREKINTSIKTTGDLIIEAARTRIGIPYKTLNCQKFVANVFDNKQLGKYNKAVLEDVGIKYFGKGGMLPNMIKNKENHGYGIVKRLCSGYSPYEKTYKSVDDVMKAIKPHLANGAIFQLEGHGRGHVGFVSFKEGKWHVIHSGGYTGSKVHEEPIEKLLQKWIDKSKYGIRFVVGTVDDTKVSNYKEKESVTSSKA